MHHLDDAAVRTALDPDELVEALATVFHDLGTGRAASTVRVRASTDGAMASAMAAALPSMGVTGGKVYATVDGRFAFHVVLFDLDGNLLCTLDGASLTEARTPALCAVVIDRYGPVDAHIGAVLGTGREAVPHLEMLARVMRPHELRLWGRQPDAVASVIAQCAERGIDVKAATAAEAAVDGADVVVTVTSADEPIVAAAAIADHALVCAVGATKPQRCETDPALFARAAAVITDSALGAPAECGDLIHAVAAGTIQWSDVVDLADAMAGTVDVVRAGVRGPVVFETQGIAAQDVAAAALVWRRLAPAFTAHHPSPRHPSPRRTEP